jgi:galactokinase
MATVDVSRIFGKIRIVKRFPDYTIQIVETGYAPGKWKLVSGHGDYNVKLVTANPDFTVSCRDKIKPAH